MLLKRDRHRSMVADGSFKGVMLDSSPQSGRDYLMHESCTCCRIFQLLFAALQNMMEVMRNESLDVDAVVSVTGYSAPRISCSCLPASGNRLLTKQPSASFRQLIMPCALSFIPRNLRRGLRQPSFYMSFLPAKLSFLRRYRPTSVA